MIGNPEAAQLTLLVNVGEDADAEELDRVARQLLEELREQEVESAELEAAGEAPEGTKAAEAAMLGALALTVLPTALPPLIGFLKDWAGRGKSANRSLKIKVETDAQTVELEYDPATMSPEDLKNLMAMLAARPTGGGAQGGVAVSAQGGVNVGQDVVGRDKTVIHAEAGATVIVNPPPAEDKPKQE